MKAGKALRRGVAVFVTVVALAVAIRVAGAIRLARATAGFEAEFGEEAAASSCRRSGGAADWLRAGALGLVLAGEEKALAAELVALDGWRWSTAQQEQARTLVAEHGAALELLHRAVGKPHLGFGVGGADADVRFGLPVFALLDASRVLGVEARLAWLDGGGERARLALAAMGTIATALEREDSAVAQGAGLFAERLLLATVAERVAVGPTADAALAAAMPDALPAVDLRQAWRRTIKRSVEVGVWRDVEASATVRSRLLAPLLEEFWLARERAVAVRLASQLDGPVEDARRVDAGLWALWSPTLAHEGALSTLSRSYRAALAARQAAAVALDLLAKGAARGTYPDDLGPATAATGPDPFTGEPLSYRRLADGGALVEIAAGERMWERYFPERGGPRPFLWRLPPPRPGRAPVAMVPPHSS